MNSKDKIDDTGNILKEIIEYVKSRKDKLDDKIEEQISIEGHNYSSWKEDNAKRSAYNEIIEYIEKIFWKVN